MSIIRGPKPENNWYMLDKKISQDRRISWQARGVLIYLLGKPDHWQVSVEALKKETADSIKPTSRDGIYSILKELESAGYVSRKPARDSQGRMSGFEYVVSEQPLTDKPLTAEPLTAERAQASIEFEQELNQTNSHQQAEDIPYELIFNTYEMVLPGKPKVRIRDDARRKAVRSMWLKDKKYQSVEFWERYFLVVRDSTFLMSQKTFAFDWLMQPKNFKKVAEGNYDNA